MEAFMIRWLGMLVFAMWISVPIQSASIVAQLEVVLSDSGGMLNGTHDVTIQLVGPDGQVRWQEIHKNIIFFNGAASFEIGGINDIKTYHFYDAGIQLLLKIGNDSVALPMHSTPFSLFSHAADMVNAIHMEHVFYSDLENRRIGININRPPRTQLEVNGALRVSEHPNPNYNEIGALRWRNNRLEGRHNDTWKPLDISSSDGLETKWVTDEDLKFYYYQGFPGIDGSQTPPRVSVQTDQSYATLTVQGDAVIDDFIDVGAELAASGRLNLPHQYGVSSNSDIYARSLKIDNANTFDFTNGLRVSGKLIGDGGGITHIQSENIADNAIQSHEIADQAIHGDQLVSNSVSNQSIEPYSIGLHHLNPLFKLDETHWASGVADNRTVARESMETADFSTDFELTLFHFMPHSIVSRNIESGLVNANILQKNVLGLEEFSFEFIDNSSILSPNSVLSTNIENESVLAEDFAPQSLSYAHLSSIASIAKGGTNQTEFGSIGSVLVVSNNQWVSLDDFIFTDDGLGLYQSNPAARLHVVQQPQTIPLKVHSNSASFSGLKIKNAVSEWRMGMTSNSDFHVAYVDDSLGGALEKSVIQLTRNGGYLGLAAPPNTNGERITVGGAVLLGDKHPNISTDQLHPGTIYFSKESHQFKFKTDTLVAHPMVGPTFGGSSGDSGVFSIAGIHNQSRQSRVLMADNIEMTGHNHAVMGAVNSVVDGQNHWVEQVESSAMFGTNLVAKYSRQSQWVGSDLMGEFLIKSSLIGTQNFGSFLTQTTLIGQGHSSSHTDHSVITGENHWVDFVSHSTVEGEGHWITSSQEMAVFGRQHHVHGANGTVVLGDQNSLRQGRDSLIQGRQNHGSFLNETMVNGSRNLAGFLTNGVIHGHGNHVLGAQGKVIGSNNRHFGGGAPTLTGDYNQLIGRHEGKIRGNNLVSIGSSSRDLSMDHAIVFHAPGGVDIVSGNLTLAVLSPHGGSWSHVSDQTLKINIESLNPSDILNKVMSLPIMEWSYNGQNYVKHIGPMAQDFHALFKLGASHRYIQSVDIDGVIFSSIQGLSSMVSTIVTQKNNLAAQESNMKLSVDRALGELRAVSASKNALVQKNRQLNRRFDQLHQNELQQLNKIQALNHKIQQLRMSMEGAL
jgi:hypothetical protein